MLTYAKNPKASVTTILAISLIVLFQNCGKGMTVVDYSSEISLRSLSSGISTTTTLRNFTQEAVVPIGPTSLPGNKIPTGGNAILNGNGHSTSWDGRFVIYTQGVGNRTLWNAYALRPEKITLTQGQVQFPADVWSTGMPLLNWNASGTNTVDSEGHSSILSVFNAISVAPRTGDPTSTNPYRGNLAGQATPQGTFLIYKLRIFTQLYNIISPNPIYTMGFFEGDLYLENPDTAQSSIRKFILTSDFVPIKQPNGAYITGVEPSVTADGKFMVYQNAADRIFTTYQLNDANPTQWSTVLSLTALHTVKDNPLRGRTVKEWYPLAAKPIKSSLGEEFLAADGVRGAYPWVSWEGGEAFFQAAGVSSGSATRTALSVVGQNTGWQMRHIDSKINEDAMGYSESRLFVSAIGMTSSIWNPQRFHKQPLAIPSLEENPVIMMLHSNGSEYFEVSFKEYLDGNYLMAWNMNEALVKISNSNFNGRFDPTKTPDTSGRNIFGNLLGGAKVPSIETPLQIGFKAQGIVTPAQGGIGGGNTSKALSSPSFTVEVFARPMVDFNQGTNKASLISRATDLNLMMTGSRKLQMTLKLGGQSYDSGQVGKSFAVQEWQHAASTFDHTTGTWRIFQNGRLAYIRVLPKTAFTSIAEVIVGHNGQTVLQGVDPAQVLFHLDEFRYSNVVRSSAEILESAGIPIEQRFQNSWFNDKIAAPLLRFLKHPEEVPMSDQKIALGELLFKDPQFSSNSQISCQTCHMPERAFADGLQFSKGVSGRALTRNTPTILNRAFGAKQMWDGKFGSVHQQVIGPLDNPDEMNLSIDTVVAKLNASEYYRNSFQALYGQAPTADLFQKSIAAFVDSLIHFDSRFDLEAKGKYTFTESELRGKDLFNGKARCVACHSGANFSDEQFHNTGILPGSTDVGRLAITNRERERKAFKTPSLRQISETAPYMHDGSVANLETVIELYNLGAPGDPNRSIEIKQLNLTPQEKQDLANFLKTL